MGADNGMEKRYNELTPKVKGRFLSALSRGYSVAHACRMVRISRVTVYNHRRDDEEFRLAWDDAVDEGTDLLEDEARRRALEGVVEPIFHKGVEVTQVKRYSDTLLIFLLKGRRPAKFRDNVDITSGGEKVKAPMVFLPQVVSEEFEADVYPEDQRYEE